jgi:hypothetical protein
MADIKRQDITLSDRTKGISADEYAWGSYFYSEWISSWYTTKWFELWPYISKTTLNTRKNWYPVALAPTKNYWILAFTSDWLIETEELFNWATWSGDDDWGWALAWRYGIGTYNTYVNGLMYWTTAIAIWDRYIDLLDVENPYDPTAELLTNPDFSDSWDSWTIWTWWTITDNWAEHTTGETWTLSATINFGSTPTSSDYVRVALKIKDATAGKLTVKLDNPSATYDIGNGVNWWITVCCKCSSSSTGVVITPTSTFNGTIEIVNVHLYTGLEFQKLTIAWSEIWQPHPALVWEWDLYVAAWNNVNIYSLSDRWRTYKSLVDENFTIVSMTQQAGNIILWATDGFDSRQYYWDWVDSVATEVIEWKWLIIKWVTGTETLSYVLTASWNTSWFIEWYEYRLYIVSWYQRSLIASKLYQYMSSNYIQREPYNLNKKFDFNDVKNDQSMVVYLDNLYLPWCDGVYKYGSDLPWMSKVWTRPIKYDVWATNVTIWQRNDFLNIGYSLNNINYIGKIDNRLYTNKWYIVTESIYRDKLSTRKALEKLKIWYKNVASTVGNIKVYMIVDDDYFWRFRPTATPTKRPEIWDVYNVAHNTTATVFNVDKTNWIITFATNNNWWSYIGTANTTLTKVSGEWDDSIAVWYKFDNMCLIKTIESDKQWYWADLIFWKDFVNNYLPYWYKIQFVIELNSNDKYLSPEIHEISMISDITDIIL